MSPRDLAYELAWRYLTTGPEDGTSAGVDYGKVALYGMISAVLVAAITAIGSYLTTRTKAGATTRTAKRTAAHYEACKLFITLNTDADVRKIKDGYEAMDEVRRAGT